MKLTLRTIKSRLFNSSTQGHTSQMKYSEHRKVEGMGQCFNFYLKQHARFKKLSMLFTQGINQLFLFQWVFKVLPLGKKKAMPIFLPFENKTICCLQR